jgi:2-polyprenyl-6-methoxyphenol hydroxylase-like FAD-dependent oxidoreductase
MPASGITKVRIFDRKNLNLPYSNGCVALLGDSAHPQSPMMGQGCNQLIVDAYVCSMHLSRQSVPAALEAYDTKANQKAVNAVIKQAQSYGNMAGSHNQLICWMFSVFASKMPLSWLWNDMISADLPNHNFVEQLDKDLSVMIESSRL